MSTETLTGGYTYTPEEPACSSYRFDRYTPGIPTASQLMLLHVSANTVDFDDRLQTSQAASFMATVAETVYSVQLDGVEVGTVTFPIGATVGQFDSPTAFQAVPGSLVSIVAPAVPDASQSDVTFTLVGTCANTPTPPEPTACCNSIRVDMTATATLGVRLTHIPRPRVRFDARAVTMGRLTNA